MSKNSLEHHLKTLCEANSEYTSLISTWNLNKKTCVDALKSIVTSYPHFSMHDASHAEAIVTKIEMLLGDRVHTLSPTDTWLILHAAYAHDLGMILKWEDIEKIWADEEFKLFLESLKDSTDNQLRIAAHEISSVLTEDSDSFVNRIDPLRMSRNVTLVNAAYFRRFHNQISRKYIELWQEGLGIDFGHSGLIQLRLIKVLGHICELHNADTDEILKIDYQTDGFGADYAHPRFISILLRLGDLLDADNGRFNSITTLTMGSLPESSMSHKEKHDSTVHLLVTPTDIEFRSDCPNPNAYLETRNFITWLESEIDFLRKNWDLIAPQNLGGYVPRFDKKELLLNGIPDIEGVTGLRFKISQEKAFQIIEGSNIYGDPFVCFREILQNAIDASKIQMWKDLCSGNYIAWMDGISITNELQPFDIDESIYKNYAIQVDLSTSDGLTRVEITDRGTGISINDFKRMCNVGVSNTAGEVMQSISSEIPAWLRPTAGFGIGLQSIFLLTDSFEIITSTGMETFKAVIHSNRNGGYLHLQKMQNNMQRGTKIVLRFPLPNQYTYSMYGETMKYLAEEYDYFSDQNFLGEVRSIEAIRRYCSDLIFPLKITSSLDDYKTKNIDASVIAGDSKYWADVVDNYRYQLDDDCCAINIWDTDKNVHGKITLCKKIRGNTIINFKGIRILKGFPHGNHDSLSIELDIYGLETKESLTLDRSSLTDIGYAEVSRIIKIFESFYVDRVIEKLNDDKLDEICSDSSFSPYRFWQACSLNQRKNLPDEFIGYISEKADILKIGEDGTFIIDKKDVKEIICELYEKIYFANVSEFKDIQEKRSEKYEEICYILNEQHFSRVSEIVVDEIILATIKKDMWKNIMIPKEDKDLLIFNITENNYALPVLDEEYRKSLICGLGESILNLRYVNSNGFGGRRYAIPVINDFECLGVDSLPPSIIRPHIRTNWIISPFTFDFAEVAKNKSKEEFVSLVLESPSLNSLVDFVLNNSIKKEMISYSDVRNAYKRLIEEYYNIVRGLE